MENGRTDKMKVLFGTDITKDKKNTAVDGDEFILRSLPEAVTEKRNKEFEKEIDMAGSMAKRFRIIQAIGSILLFFGLLGIVEILEDEAGMSLSLMREAISQNILWFSVLFVAFLLGVLILVICEAKRKKKITEYEKDDEIKDCEDKKYIQQALSYLGVPKSAKNVDVICPNYVIRNGEPVLKTLKVFGSLNAELKLFSDESAVYIADAENLYFIGFTDIEKISKYNGKLTLMFWNKKTAHNKGKYQPYHIRKRDEFKYTVQTYYSLDINREGETYKMYFPPYELDVIERLTGVKYEE